MTKLVNCMKKTDAEKYEQVGITTQENLFTTCRNPKRRMTMAKKTRISQTTILKYVNHIAMTRIKGLGEKYVVLLEKAGIVRVSQLGKMAATSLHARLVNFNKSRHIVKGIPSTKKLTAWIRQAKRFHF